MSMSCVPQHVSGVDLLPETELGCRFPELLDFFRVPLLDELIVNYEQRVGWHIIWEWCLKIQSGHVEATLFGMRRTLGYVGLLKSEA